MTDQRVFRYGQQMLLPIRPSLREHLARIISPFDWSAKDDMSDADFRYTGFSVESSLIKADTIISLIEEMGVAITTETAHASRS